jgi:hypothetical protein
MLLPFNRSPFNTYFSEGEPWRWPKSHCRPTRNLYTASVTSIGYVGEAASCAPPRFDQAGVVARKRAVVVVDMASRQA